MVTYHLRAQCAERHGDTNFWDSGKDSDTSALQDTHVWRITKNLGWVPKNASREETYEHLNTRIPDDIKCVC